MQPTIDFIFANWYILLPITILLIIVIGFLIKRGQLESLDIFGIKINFQTAPKGPVLSGERSLKNYGITFSKTAMENLSSLGMREDRIIFLIENEFKHHINYFYWDLQDYPLPIQQNYIVVLDKIGKSLTIRAVKPSDLNESQLASINNLLADYRRLTRYNYRTTSNYVLRPETIKEIMWSHSQLILRLVNHYTTYKEPHPDKKELTLDFLLTYEYLKKNPENPDTVSFLESTPMPSNKAFTYNIIAATDSLSEVRKLHHDAENQFIQPDIADREIVLSLERSLQYIHKTINLLLED